MYHSSLSVSGSTGLILASKVPIQKDTNGQNISSSDELAQLLSDSSSHVKQLQ